VRDEALVGHLRGRVVLKAVGELGEKPQILRVFRRHLRPVAFEEIVGILELPARDQQCRERRDARDGRAGFADYAPVRVNRAVDVPRSLLEIGDRFEQHRPRPPLHLLFEEVDAFLRPADPLVRVDDGAPLVVGE
jgi:hypothetical protein